MLILTLESSVVPGWHPPQPIQTVLEKVSLTFSESSFHISGLFLTWIPASSRHEAGTSSALILVNSVPIIIRFTWSVKIFLPIDINPFVKDERTDISSLARRLRGSQGVGGNAECSALGRFYACSVTFDDGGDPTDPDRAPSWGVRSELRDSTLAVAGAHPGAIGGWPGVAGVAGSSRESRERLNRARLPRAHA